MCTRSGLVIKTAPVVRSSLCSPRLRSDCQSRAAPRDLAAVGSHSLQQQQQQQPASPAQHQSAGDAGAAADSSDASAGPSTSGVAVLTKTGAGRTNGAMRARSLDFLSVVTRYQLARRARAVLLGADAGNNSLHDEDSTYSALELDFIPDDNARFLYFRASKINML